MNALFKRILNTNFIQSSGTGGQVVEVRVLHADPGAVGLPQVVHDLSHCACPGGQEGHGARAVQVALAEAVVGQLKLGSWRPRAAQGVEAGLPMPGGAEYVAVCRDAFSPDTVNRDD